MDISEIIFTRINERLDHIEQLIKLSTKNVLTVEDVAELTGFSKTYIHRLTCDKEIPHYKPRGSRIYFDRAEVEEWMKQNRIAPIQKAEGVIASMDVELPKKHKHLK